jgi:NADH-quinone oxidoreductase subunit N
LIMLSLAGIPLTAGFIGKFYIFMTGVNTSSWVLLAALIIGSGIGLYYYLRVMLALFSRDVSSAADQVEASISQSSSLLVILVAILVLWLGVYPQPALEFIASLG